MTIKEHSRLGCAVLALSFLGVACAGGSGELPPPAAGQIEKTKISVGLLPTVGVAPFYVAFQDRLFQTEGFTSVDPKIAVTGVTEALIGGEFDMVYSAYVVPFQARAEGLPVQIVAAADQVPAGIDENQETVGVVVLPDSPIKTVKDLEGKKIGVPTVAIGEVFLFPDMQREGVNTKKVKLAEVFFPQMLQVLERGSVDAIFAPEPLYTEAKETLKVRRIYNPFIGLDDPFPIAGYFTTEKFARENPNTVAAFRRAVARASKTLNDNWARGAKALPLYMAIKEEQARKLLPPNYATKLDAGHLQLVSDAMFELKLLKKKLDVTQFILE